MRMFGQGFFACLLALGALSPAGAVSILDRWDDAADLLQKMNAATDAGGTASVARFLPMADVVLARDDGATVYYDASAQHAYALADGDVRTAPDYELSDGKHVPMSTRPNPYPRIRLKLGMYYNDMRQPALALHEADAGLKASGSSLKGYGGDTLDLIYEKARALVLLRRSAEALDTFDAGIRLAGDGSGTHLSVARFWNGRGYVLRTLGRLDEAETDYRQALKVEPENQTARRGLETIATYRALKSKAELSKLLPH